MFPCCFVIHGIVVSTHVETVVLMLRKDYFLQLSTFLFYKQIRSYRSIRGKSEALSHADVSLIIVQTASAQFATKRGAGQGSSKVRYFKKLLLGTVVVRLRS